MFDRDSDDPVDVQTFFLSTIEVDRLAAAIRFHGLTVDHDTLQASARGASVQRDQTHAGRPGTRRSAQRRQCGWANGYHECDVPGCKFPGERCVEVKRQRGEA